MKRPALKQDLVPVQEFRADLARWLRRASETKRPVIVTQRGRASAVVVSPEMLDEMEDSRALVQETLRGLRDLAAGRLVADADVWQEVEGVIAAAERKRARQVE